MTKKGGTGDVLRCSFCNKSQRDVKKLIAGPTVYICDECVDICLDIIAEDRKEESGGLESPGDLPKPQEIKEFLDSYVVCQERAKRKLAVAVYNHYKRIEHQQKAPRNEVAQQCVATFSGDDVNIRLVASFPKIILRLEDDGQGFDVMEQEASRHGDKHLGLLGMRERVALLKGNIKIESQLEKGTKISLEIPWKGEDLGTKEETPHC